MSQPFGSGASSSSSVGAFFAGGGVSGEFAVPAVAVELEGTVGRVAFVISGYWGGMAGISRVKSRSVNEAAYEYSRIWGWGLIREPVGWGSSEQVYCTAIAFEA